MEPEADRIEDLILRAADPDWSVRADAGERIAKVDDLESLAGVLVRLLLDGEDTAVTCAVADALVKRGDDAGLELILRAAGRAEEADYLDHMQDSFLASYANGTSDQEAVASRARGLAELGDEAVRRGVLRLFSEEDYW